MKKDSEQNNGKRAFPFREKERQKESRSRFERLFHVMILSWQRDWRTWQLTRNTYVLLLVFLFLLGGWWFFFSSNWVTTNDAYVTGNVIPVKAQTSGRVVEVLVESTQYVNKNQVLVRLDSLNQRVAFEGAKQNLAMAVRKVEDLFNKAKSLRNKIAAQKAILGRQRYDLGLYASGSKAGVVSMQDAIDAQWKVQEIESTIRQLEDELHSTESWIQKTTVWNNPIVLKAAVDLKNAYLALYRCQIVAPVAGYVARRSVQVGDEVTPDRLLMSIVPLDYYWVVANYRETELRKMRPGQPVKIRADIYGRRYLYHGVVEGLEPGSGTVFALLPPDNATGNYIHVVERIPVRIRLDPKELIHHPLRLGLSVVTKVNVSHKGNSVLKPITEIPANAKTSDYTSTYFSEELSGVEELIKTIIEENRYPQSEQKENISQKPDAPLSINPSN
ncbi:membrane fusion protein of tripartite multidrug resistance system [Methylacidiphilum kamchatkense Kam1]|uniref:Membrane fusion protein (Multidrug efflux system) n=1 Tax=Methylacidiphilum kamchatkense Kam1 TaxID=1202785 RepID=A0A0C1RIH6_9BACT|nr:HlyD family efflux transporter periplasmic adaptor subunit [Methylacidiphilum kamchatkense]KIE57817.1 membrane fusion protein of tripartite multidrug resistance system [Methylacidiphilum kamchatkense Kam1]QDQ41433.1 membrane fusion protein (multidrug efflux system) [Methylacidiphilum kamchatkense Kam1]